ncbi:MAG: SDR family oxidoreductase [Phycisphaerales bacterium]|jgi:NAD(P)-dependent dehydrogenase (short-subunit alcohol dehydrogenase family)|nr:SDR family oxidoreductase [Phycisphaerales bacterium]
MNPTKPSSVNRDQNLAGQVAIISGGLGDIGSAIAVELAGRGAAVALGDIKPAADARPFLDNLNPTGRRSRYDQVDVTDWQQVGQWVERVESDLGPPTLIIPNAAVVTLVPTCEMSPAQWSRDLRVNLDGAFHLAQAAILRLRAHQRPGRVVFIGSWAAHSPHVHIPAYCASKAALRMLCKTMALELAEFDILVNEVAPGYVDAGLTAAVWRENPQLRVSSLKTVPVGRLISPAEVAFQVAHLCDPANRHMTGTSILMDGGLSLTNAATLRKDER